MMRNKYERTIYAPRGVVFETFREKQTDMNRKLPNIVDSRVVEVCEDGDCRRRMVIWVAGNAPIPVVLRPLINPKQIEWRVFQLWDARNWTCDFQTEATHFKDNVDVKGRWTFDERIPGRTDVVIESTISIDARGIPGLPPQLATPVGALVERIMQKLTAPNIEKVFKVAEAMVKSEMKDRKKGSNQK